MRGGADTITMYPALEGLLHPDYYDNHRKVLMGCNVIFDDTMDKYVIELKNINVLENLKAIPDVTSPGEVNLKKIEDCDEEQVINYIEGLMGFVIIENLIVN
jgi:hypothetical protein